MSLRRRAPKATEDNASRDGRTVSGEWHLDSEMISDMAISAGRIAFQTRASDEGERESPQRCQIRATGNEHDQLPMVFRSPKFHSERIDRRECRAVIVAAATARRWTRRDGSGGMQ